MSHPIVDSGLLDVIEAGNLEDLNQDDLIKLYMELKTVESQLGAEEELQDIIEWAYVALGVRPESLIWDDCVGFPVDHDWDSGVYNYSTDQDGDRVIEFEQTPSPIAYMMRAVQGKRKRIGVEGGTGTGKTYGAAIIVLYFLEKYGPNDCRVYTFSTKKEQLQNHLWKDIGSLWDKFKKRHPKAEFLSGSLRIHMDATKDNKVIWSARGYSARVGEAEEAAAAVKGIHGPNLLFIFEEMQGIDPAIDASIRATAGSPNNIMLALGNPSAEFDNLHNFCTSSGTLHLRVSSLDHPNFITNNPYLIPGGTSKELIDDLIEVVSGDLTNPYYLSNVRGICPMGSAKSIITENLLRLTEEFALTDRDDEVDVRVHGDEEFPITQDSEGMTLVYSTVEQGYIRRYFACADIAGDDLKGDWHSCIIGDRIDMKPVALIHMRGPREDFAKECVRVCNKYVVRWPDKNDVYYPLLAWERNMGAFNLEEQIKTYPNIYRPKSMDTRSQKRSQVMGWHTGTKSRYEMQEALKKWLSSLYEYPERIVSAELRRELKTFVVSGILRGGKSRYEASPGHFDDIVLSWMIFCAVDQEHHDRPPLEVGLIKAMPQPILSTRETIAKRQGSWGQPQKWSKNIVKW